MKDELYDSFVIDFFNIFYKLFEQPKYLIILSKYKLLISQIIIFWKFYNFLNWTTSNIRSFSKFVNIANWEIG